VVVEFAKGKAAGFRAVTATWKGPWKEARVRKEFEQLAKWASAHGVRTGRWYFGGRSENAWRVAIEVKGKVRGADGVHVKEFPATEVVRVKFDPDEVSPMVVYHGLNDYLRARRKDKSIKSVGWYREVYEANPWSNAKAWSNLTVEATVRS
jgi:hypothetical protein